MDYEFELIEGHELLKKIKFKIYFKNKKMFWKWINKKEKI